MKRFLIMFAFITLGAFIFSSCAEQAPVTKSSSSTSTPVAKPIELSFAIRGSATSWGQTYALKPWIKQVEEATKGSVKIVVYPAQTLTKAPEWDAVKNGVADMAWVVSSDLTAVYPFTDMLTVNGPGTARRSATESGEVMWQLYEKFEAIRKETAAFHVLIIHGGSMDLLASSKKQIKTLEDIKNLKIRAVGAGIGDTVRAWGANAVETTGPELYQALQQGVVDGAITNAEMIISYRLWEVSKYVTTNVPVNSPNDLVIMNLNKWNSLPQDIQNQITSVSGREGSKFWSKNWCDASLEALPEQAKKPGYEMAFYSLPSAEAVRWEELLKSSQDQWVKEMEAKGKSNAREILNAMIKIIKDIQK